jgi:hypothetical protein
MAISTATDAAGNPIAWLAPWEATEAMGMSEEWGECYQEARDAHLAERAGDRVSGAGGPPSAADRSDS